MSVTEHAHLHLRAGDLGEPTLQKEQRLLSSPRSPPRHNVLDAAAETLVLCGVIVLQTNLELDLYVCARASEI